MDPVILVLRKAECDNLYVFNSKKREKRGNIEARGDAEMWNIARAKI